MCPADDLRMLANVNIEPRQHSIGRADDHASADGELVARLLEPDEKRCEGPIAGRERPRKFDSTWRSHDAMHRNQPRTPPPAPRIITDGWPTAGNSSALRRGSATDSAKRRTLAFCFAEALDLPPDLVANHPSPLQTLLVRPIEPRRVLEAPADALAHAGEDRHASFACMTKVKYDNAT